MQRINRLTVILFGLAFASAAPVPGEQPSASRESAPSPTPEPRVVYARVKAYLPDSDDVIASISAVYALYSPVLEARGYAVVASPTSDGCAQAPKRPPGLPPSQPWVLVARLASRSSCTALEQGRLAAAAGASAVINMSPQQSRYIYLLERTVDEAASGAMPAPIPQLSISGGAGLELLDEIYSASDPLILNIGISGGGDISTLGAADIAVAVACIVFSLAVLIYALRVSRRLCAPLPLPEHSSIDETDAENHVSPELTLCLKHIMSSRIPPHPASRRLQGADAAPPPQKQARSWGLGSRRSTTARCASTRSRSETPPEHCSAGTPSIWIASIRGSRPSITAPYAKMTSSGHGPGHRCCPRWWKNSVVSSRC